MKSLFTAMLLLMLTVSLHSQNDINNSLGVSGTFTIKDGTPATFLSISQSTGNLSLNKSITIPVTTVSTVGVIFKGANRFIHDFQVSDTDGKNIFVGLNSGNFAISATSSYMASNNTAVGYASQISLTTGYKNSAVGFKTLYTNTSGNTNSSFGSYSLYYNTSGYFNSAFGYSTLYNSTISRTNSTFGSQSLYMATAGSYSSVFGYQAHYLCTGGSNSAFGSQSILSDGDGTGNAAFGNLTLKSNTSGYSVTAFGYKSLYSNKVGLYNSAFGYCSLYKCTGSSNSALGDTAGGIATSGSNNVFIGYNAQPSSVTISNEVTLGNSSVTKLRCKVTAITALSDARDKKNIRDLPLGLDFLMTLKPRMFNWDRREWYKNRKSNGSKMEQIPTAGFIAQELDEAQTKAGAKWLNLVLKSNPKRLEATPGNLLPVMVKAIQELKIESDAIKHDLTTFHTSIAELVKEEVQKVLLKAKIKYDTASRVSFIPEMHAPSAQNKTSN
ncbi:MAG: tail fiber domain-containing protein [Ignavibacteriaceae bacterium]